MRIHPLAAIPLVAAVLAPAAASADSIVGIDTSNRLVTFKSDKGQSAKTRAITGLPAGEQLVGIDRRPDVTDRRDRAVLGRARHDDANLLPLGDLDGRPLLLVDLGANPERGRVGDDEHLVARLHPLPAADKHLLDDAGERGAQRDGAETGAVRSILGGGRRGRR